MKVILLKDISKLGKRGDLQEVADGYAINVLIRKGDALMATPAELSKWKAKEDSKKHKQEMASNMFAQMIDSLRQNPIVISDKKRDGKGQLFAQIKEDDVVDAVFKISHVSIDPKQVSISKNIKSLGSHEVILKQGAQSESIWIVVK